MYREIKECRICGNTNLKKVLDLGEQCLTGVFPKTKDTVVTSGPLCLVKCDDESKTDACGLLQLQHSFDHNEMYGENYGYRSGLNKSMVEHLKRKTAKIHQLVNPSAGDIILDIGSNDATLLKSYPENGYRLIGIDPTGNKFKRFYTDAISLVPDFFSASNFKKIFPTEKARIVSSIAMFYDLERPMDFMQDIYDVLHDEGVWVFEQSYMPTMLEMKSYDTVCHEHLEYYAVKQIEWMADKVGFRIIDVQLNDVNGGSFEIVCCKKEASYKANEAAINELKAKEEALKLHSEEPYIVFAKHVESHRNDLLNKLKEIKAAGKKVVGYGASTKGNVILQYCNITTDLLPAIAEVNEDKFGSFTPGSLIPIISEADAKAAKPDYMLVLPWHFKANFLEREKTYMSEGGKLLFPLPEIYEVGN